ncbi:hypothetical protein P170DRAFT_456874 [Aspergillus steynii IBT 23096]|uniref:Uncharacterized protein n=1 Tax=Aspergillus steynii IBT 23096 TaxID=1392250 RepID=A0A2I2G608_9EURO|nr:uncharacterized protein P170DRAFT_456874 [Aspergillus steynii IBT 23096]PLB48308.1 hypothetical protein P170DRAFT_456874 [Aspergillus steynii IBT 23096]
MGLDFPTTHGDWKFDLVGLLAIIGESIIDEVVQPLTASRTVLLPRLLPAPHALIRPSRRAALPSTPVTVVGIHTGIQLQSVPYFPSIIHQLDLIQPFEFQEMSIKMAYTEEPASHGTHDKLATVRALAPLKVITILIVAIPLVSFASSFHSAASFWQSDAKPRVSGTNPPGDLALRTREGAFIVVHCSQEVARLLYTGEGRCRYVAGAAYRVLIYVGTLFLMVGIVVMSNCSWTMQVTLGISYLALNVVYMFCALTPEVSRLWHWELRMIDAVMNTTIQSSNYTEVLWHGIRATKSIEWIKKGGFAPATKAWDKWLDEAVRNCENPGWDAVDDTNWKQSTASTTIPHAHHS